MGPTTPVQPLPSVSSTLNGAGKTTLLRLLAGELSPTLGEIVWTPSQPLIPLRPQEVELDDAVRELALAWDKRSRRWRKRLGLDEDARSRGCREGTEWAEGYRERGRFGGLVAGERDRREACSAVLA